MEGLMNQFKLLIDPSSALGAFLISSAASIFVGFIAGKKYENYQYARNVNGDVIQNSTVNKK